MQNEGNNTGVAPAPPNWGELVRQKRKELGESQTVFGARWDVSYAAVSKWELNQADPPAEVIWWLLEGADNGQK